MYDVLYSWFDNTPEVVEERSIWMIENIKGQYWVHGQYCDVICFEKEEDALAFKIMWS